MDDADLKAAGVLEELRRLAFVDIRGSLDAAGNPRPIGRLTEVASDCHVLHGNLRAVWLSSEPCGG
jgi:hypothetical protein